VRLSDVTFAGTDAQTSHKGKAGVMFKVQFKSGNSSSALLLLAPTAADADAWVAAINANVNQLNAAVSSSSSSSSPSSSQAAADGLIALPQLALELILQDFCVRTARDVPALVRVCKRFQQLLTTTASANVMWHRLTAQRWVFVDNQRVPIRDWRKYFQTRAVAVSTTARDAVVQNCLEWEFKCPIALERLQATADERVNWCGVCKENVYLVNNIEDLMSHVTQSHCVVADFNRVSMSPLDIIDSPPSTRLAGRVRYSPIRSPTVSLLDLSTSSLEEFPGLPSSSLIPHEDEDVLVLDELPPP
jgi:hypothetical protein